MGVEGFRSSTVLNMEARSESEEECGCRVELQARDRWAIRTLRRVGGRGVGDLNTYNKDLMHPM